MKSDGGNSFTFIDGIGPINMIDGVIRIDLLSVTDIQKEKIATQKIGGLALTLNSFLKMHEQMNKIVEEMAEKGVIQKRVKQEETAKKKEIK
jgi:hypothetical protein